MRPPTPLALALALLPAAMADWPSCAPSCKSCGLYCNEGCPAPLVLSDCNRCLYCRRESSSCSFTPVSWPEDPPDPGFCAQCAQSCHCYIDAQCYDNVTITVPPSSSGAALPTPFVAARGPR